MRIERRDPGGPDIFDAGQPGQLGQRAPVQRCCVDQPSVHAMGRSAVTRGRARSCSRLSETRRAPTSTRRQLVPVAAGVMPTEAAV